MRQQPVDVAEPGLGFIRELKRAEKYEERFERYRDFELTRRVAIFSKQSAHNLIVWRFHWRWVSSSSKVFRFVPQVPQVAAY